MTCICHFRRAREQVSLCFRSEAGSRSGGGGGPKRREVGSRRDSAGVSAAVIVRGPSRPPSLARARGVRRELAGCGQGSGTRRVLDRREGRGGGPRIESPLPHGPSDWRARLRFSQETPVRSGGGGSPDSDPRRGVGHGGNQRPGPADRAAAALRTYQRERSQGPVR